MPKWIKTSEAADVQEGRSYFLARRPVNPSMPSWYFYATDINGKRIMSTKAGIAVRFPGGDSLRSILTDHPEFVAIEIPDDADKRWKRRRKKC